MSAPSSLADNGIKKVEDIVPANAVTASTKKQPPPDKPEAIRTRAFVIASFWAIIIFLGLPIWWKTTAIYRADLPLNQMNDWAEGRVCCPVALLQPN